MDAEPGSELLLRADAAYTGVVADPAAYGPEAARLVAQAKRTGDTEALVVALRAQAWSERARLANTHAKELLDEAATVARRHRLVERLRDVLVTRAAVNHELGRLTAAQRDLDRAAALGCEGGSAELLLQQAALHQNVGRLPEASRLYTLLLADVGCPPDVRAKAGNNLALIEAQHGRSEAALRYLDTAAAAAAEVGPALVAIVAQTRAWAAVQAGRLVESLQQLDEASRLYRAAGLPLGEHYLEHADALTDLRLLPEASAMARRAATQFSAHDVLLMAAEAQLRVARLALLAGAHHEAATAATQAAGTFRAQGRTAWAASAEVVAVDAQRQAGEVHDRELGQVRRAARTLDRLGISSGAVDAHLVTGRVAIALGRHDVALGSLQRARELAARLPVLARLHGRIAAALASDIREDHRGVLRHCRAGLDDLARHRAALASMELRALASGHGAELGRLGLAVRLRTGSATDVLEWMERTRAAATAAVAPPAVEGIEEELADLRVVHAELAQARRDSGREPPELLAEQTAIERRIRRDMWARGATSSTVARPFSPAEVRTLLGGYVLVEYGIHDERLFAAVLEPRRTRLAQLGALAAVRNEAAALLFALRRLGRPGSPAAIAAARTNAEVARRRLAELLLGPLTVPRDTPLVIVPPAGLQRLPWSALHPAPVSVAPSASLWAGTALRGHDGPPNVVLAAGPDLPGATGEVEALQACYEDATVLVPPASTVAAVTRALDGADLAHLACHGHLRADNPTFSALAWSDGPLTVHELHVRGISPRRVILAACDSGADVSYEGDELLGFVSALLARGTAGLVASIVTVPDLDALPLMLVVHEELRGGATLSAALAAARATLDCDQPGQFVNWCAFNAFGAG